MRLWYDIAVRLMRLLPVGRRLAVKVKEHEEFKYWTRQKAREGVLAAKHFEGIMTAGFGLVPAFYTGKRILDVGCGPRGSLEWAEMARQRVGLDPLACRYRELGTARHAMRYVTGVAERMPFTEGSFDVVTSLNSLDHVSDLRESLAEVTRVTRRGGHFVVAVEVHARPRPTEPVSVPWNLAQMLATAFTTESEERLVASTAGLAASVLHGQPLMPRDTQTTDGVLKLRLRRL